MENSSNMSDAADKVKGILTSMKSPLKHNLSKINDILDLFDKSTVALLNPIKKLKISATAKFEDLMELEKKGKEAEKENETKDENCSKEAIGIEEPKECKVNEKYAKIINDFSNKISILNDLLNTEEFKQLTSFSSNLNSNKKKANKDPLTLNLNEDDTNNINAFKPIKSLKNKSSSKPNKREIELSPNPENSGEKNVFDDIFNNEENESLTKSFDSDLEDELNSKENTKKNNSNNKNETSVKASGKKKKPSGKSSKNSSNKTVNSNGKGSKNSSLLKKKTNRSTINASKINSKSKGKAKNSSIKKLSGSINITSKTNKRVYEPNINSFNNFSNNILENASPNSSAEAENINAIANKKEREEKEINSEEEAENDETTAGRRLTDEECLEKMKEKLPNDKGLTKTFITRKLRKKVMVTRVLDFTRFDTTVKNVENSIPKKSGPNNFLKFSVKTSSDDELKPNSNLVYFLKDLFITNFIVLKRKENVNKIVIAGSINKDIIHFLKRIATQEFKDKYQVKSAKVKAYAFYEELVHEFTERKDVSSSNLTSDDIDGLLKQYEYLSHMRNCYEEIKRIRIVE